MSDTADGARQLHTVPAERVFALLDSRPAGLSSAEVDERLAEVGPNRLQVVRRLWWLRSLVRQLTSFFTVLLDIAALVCFVAERMQPGEGMALMGWALLGVSLLNALFSFFQEFRAERAMQALRKFLPQQVLVRRDGVERTALAEALVPGDVLLLREGDRVPADARLVESAELAVSNAPLTGESLPVQLRAAAAEGPLIESPNLVFAGCAVVKGQGLAVVYATGLRTEFGRIASLSQEISRKVSPLERETAHMVRVLTAIATGLGLAFFSYGVLSGRPLWVNLVFMMGIIVANVPEGLLPTFTLSLALSSLRMARRNVLVKSLNAVEALGAVHVICTDKTGTLTRNELAVAELVDGTGAPLEGPARAALVARGLVASDVHRTADGWSGDPLDVAIARELGDAPPHAVQRVYPFDTDARRAAGVASPDGQPTLVVKGAWEALLPDLTLEPAQREAAEQAVGRLARAGYRVIAVAERTLDAVPAEDVALEDLARRLSLRGLVALEDPLRAEVPAAVARCHAAGIDVIMITGDHPETALAVARRAGIVGPEATAEQVIGGAQLARMRERELLVPLRSGVRVFARTTPEQKLKIVAALHELDRVVAVTGDGVNDAPALKAADVGIAMGASGTEVARESAQVILLDDDFASIVAGVEEGRTVFANIRKFTNYVLVSNGPEILPYLLYILFPVPLALTVIQILTIDLGTDIIPSMALGTEPPDPEVMRQPPRRADDGLLTGALIAHAYGFLGLIEAAFSLGLFFTVLVAGGWRWGEPLGAADPLYHSACGIALASILLMQIGNLVGRRSRHGSGLDRGLLRNRLLLAGVVLQVVFSAAILYVPAVGRVLGTGPVSTGMYALAWLGIPLIFGLDYLRKRVAMRWATA